MKEAGAIHFGHAARCLLGAQRGCLAVFVDYFRLWVGQEERGRAGGASRRGGERVKVFTVSAMGTPSKHWLRNAKPDESSRGDINRESLFADLTYLWGQSTFDKTA